MLHRHINGSVCWRLPYLCCTPQCAKITCPVSASVSLAFFHPPAGDPDVVTAAGFTQSMMPDPLPFLRGMMINRTIGQTPPDKANELFAQLLETSHDAVELRERLFSELGQELELLGSLQEEHLFPVDRKSTRLNSSHANISYAVFCLK